MRKIETHVYEKNRLMARVVSVQASEDDRRDIGVLIDQLDESMQTLAEWSAYDSEEPDEAVARPDFDTIYDQVEHAQSWLRIIAGAIA